MEPDNSLSSRVDVLNDIGVNTKDLISILQAMEEAGGLWLQPLRLSSLRLLFLVLFVMVMVQPRVFGQVNMNYDLLIIHQKNSDPDPSDREKIKTIRSFYKEMFLNQAFESTTCIMAKIIPKITDWLTN